MRRLLSSLGIVSALVAGAATFAPSAAARPLLLQPVLGTALGPVVVGPARAPRPHRRLGRWHVGEASHYGVDDGLLGSAMACGGVLDARRPVVANRTLPCGTRLRICRGARCITAVVRDRGPYVGGRVLDLGPRVARALRFVPVGVGAVRYAVVRR